MKEFFKTVLATITGIVILTVLAGVFFFISLIGMMTSAGEAKSVANNSVLVVNLSGLLQERAVNDNPLADIAGESNPEIGLDDVLSAIKKAKDNDKIKGIYIEAGAFAADSYASVQAIHDALKDFRKSGKWIIAYGDSYTQSAYYIASTANKIYLNPQGMIAWHGIASQPIYVKDLLAKLGIKVQVAKVGAYKSATEMFTGDSMSPSDREQTTAYISGIWQQVTADVAKNRNLTPQKLNQYADSAITYADPNDYLKLKLVDGLIYPDEVKKVVKKQLGIDEERRIHQLTVDDMLLVDDDEDGDDEIAVYYAYGDIVDGATSALANGHLIDAQVVCKDLEELADDEDVKAVVIRINSGGGSAYASEQIWHQIMQLKKAKPVVVSMGGMAASGAYYMSAPANWIIAEPTTLTGSIGIFGMFPDVSSLMKDKLGLKFDEVKTNKYSLLGTMSRPFTADEMAYIEGYVSRGYKLFKHRVAQGRKMSDADVEKIAQGHVWLGKDALKIHLVDELGSLDDAVKKAAALAHTADYYAESYPEPEDWLENLMSDEPADNYLSQQMHAMLGSYYDIFTTMAMLKNQNPVQARIMFLPNIH